MSHPSKNKGNRYERELVQEAINNGLGAQRAYASNGAALGHAPEVDCVVEGQRIQAKIRKRIASFLQVPLGCDAVCFRQTTGPIEHRRTMTLIRWDDYLELLRKASAYDASLSLSTNTETCEHDSVKPQPDARSG